MFTFIKQHKVGILATVLFHLIILNLFFISKLSFIKKPAKNEVTIDIPITQPVKEKKYDIHEVINRNVKISDEIDYTNYASRLEKLQEVENKLYKNINVEDNPDVSEEYKKEVLQRALGDDYEKYLNKPNDRSENEALAEKKQSNNDSSQYHKSHVIKNGPSTLVYDIEKRYGVYLPLPVYKCIGGGTVIVEIEVNRSGSVLKSQIVNSNQNTENECLIEAALKASNTSIFNSDNNSPAIQKGSIIYTFIPQ